MAELWVKKLLIGVVAAAAFGAALACGAQEQPPAPAPAQPAAPAPAQPTAPPPPPTAAPTGPSEPTGELIVAVENVGPPNYNVAAAPHPFGDRAIFLSIFETVQDYDGSQLQPMIASSWELTPEGVTFKIRNDIPFHNDWGNATPADVVESYEQVASDESIHTNAGLMREDYASFQALDDETVFMQLKQPTVRWSVSNMPDFHAAWIMSKRALDEEGRDWTIQNAVGTGPFKMTKHVADDFIDLEAIPDHWRKTPAFATVKVLGIPEAATRIAMLSTRQTDISSVTLGVLDQVKQVEGINLYTGKLIKSIMTLSLAGQYYVTHDADGNPVDRSEGKRELQSDLPWVGDPTNPDSMEAARLVRQGISRLIDRDALVDTVLAGQGCASHVFVINDCHPRYEPDRWDFDYDPDEAKRLIAEGGYPDGFDFRYLITSGLSTEYEEVSEALIPMFEAVGMKPQVEKGPYSVHRPTFLGRTVKGIWTSPMGGNGDLAGFAIFELAALTQGGVWNAGQEWDAAGEFYKEGLGLVDPDEAWGLMGRFHDWTQEQMPVVPVVTWKSPWVAGPKVKEWAFPVHTANFPSSLEDIVPDR